MVVVLHYLHFVFWKKPSTYKLYFLIREFREEGIFKSGAKAHSSLRQFLATEVMKNAFHFVLEALCSQDLYFCLNVLFMYKNGLINFKTYDVTIWLTNIYSTHIAQYLTKYR